MAKSDTGKIHKIGPQKHAKVWVYVDRETGEEVLVSMSFDQRDRCSRYGFLELPDGRELRFSMEGQLRYERKHGLRKDKKSNSKIRTRARWPLKTELVGVGEHQVDELRREIQKRGLVGTEVNPDGTVTWSDKKARYNYCRAFGLYDRNAGYSDPAPLNR